MDIQKINSKLKGAFSYKVFKKGGLEYEAHFDSFLKEKKNKYLSIAHLHDIKNGTSTILNSQRIHVRSDDNQEEFNLNLSTGNFFYFKKFGDGTKFVVENGKKTISYVIKNELIKEWLRTIKRKKSPKK